MGVLDNEDEVSGESAKKSVIRRRKVRHESRELSYTSRSLDKICLINS
jgi:hypothetical protein